MEKIRPISCVAVCSKMDLLTLCSIYTNSVCKYEDKFSTLECVEGACTECRDQLTKKYSALLKEKGTMTL